jgi:glycine oxidase
MNDALVIGAGIIGSSIAWRLAQQGLGVTLLDAGNVGGEASWAGAGMLAPGGEVTDRTEWSDFAVHSLHLYPEFVAELEGESGVSIDYQRSGALDIAPSDADWPALQERAAKQRALGIPSVPADRENALFYPEDAAVDPRDVMRALLAACRSRRVRIEENSPVTGIAAAPGPVAVETASGRIAAGFAVLAAGAWSGSIPFSGSGIARILPGSFPVKGHLLGYYLEPGSCPTILRRGQTYILQRSSGFTICGSSMETIGFDRRVDPEIVRDISRRGEDLLPMLRGAGAPEAWIGFRPRADAHRPQIGRFADSNLWLAYGHFRNGILLAPATAERVAGEIMSSAGMGSSSRSGTR